MGWVGRVDRKAAGHSGGDRLRLRHWRRRGFLLGRRLDADMLGIEALLTRHQRPQDSGVLVGHGHAGFLPAHPLDELFEPAAGEIGRASCRERV